VTCLSTRRHNDDAARYRNALESTRTIDIDEFVPKADID
jgi:DNA end-binding protein Ku